MNQNFFINQFFFNALMIALAILFISVTTSFGQESEGIGKEAALIDSLKINIPEIEVDSLKNLAETSVEGVIVNDIKSKAMQVSDNYGPNLTGQQFDSVSYDQYEGKLKKYATNEVERKLDHNISDIVMDSTLSNQLKHGAKSTAKAELEGELGVDVSGITIDSTATEQVKKEAVKKAEAAIKSTNEYKELNDFPKETELDKMEDYKAMLDNIQNEINQATAKQQLKKKMNSYARDYISNHADKIPQVQSQMGDMKKKYSHVANSNDLSSAVKQSSLKGESFWKRLVLGGNFNISKTNPMNIDLSPVLGYKINKLFEAGITGVYRSQFSGDKNGVVGQSGDEVYGYSVFASHMAFKNFFAYLEGERMRTTTLSTENPEKQWRQTLLIGFGRKIRIIKFLEMQTMILCNVLHDNKDGLYSSPIVFKTGVRVTK